MKPRPKLTQEQAERLVEVLLKRGRGTRNEVWIYVDRRYEIVGTLDRVGGRT